ncbi:hypothetical protein ACHAPC_008431 [Botrytis cinerea]|uniref:BTB domain-containing protein n=1 Tax=Botryotinia fuckeliana (strain BcDW1) TaxID=1290391 RepID=M7TEB8_BOTF1|nr:hypothetical protein BcDW1_9541 [Botrytis cinerea BcDW1]
MAANGPGINLGPNQNLGFIPWPQPGNTMSQLDAIIADTDDEVLAGMGVRLEAYILTAGNRSLSRENVLRISRILATTYQAPGKPKTTKSALAPLRGGYDIDNQKNFNKIVSVNVGTGKQRVQFKALAGVLATQAEYFKPLCSDLWRCGREGVISLEDFRPESFEIFLAWLYTKDIRNAKGLIKKIKGNNAHFRTQAYKFEWFQLLHCYFLADYIGAPKFANYLMNALTLSYRGWVRDGFVKSAKNPLFNKTEETIKLVDSNTIESSPLRALIKDIIFPSIGEGQFPITVDPPPGAPSPFRRTRRGLHNLLLPDSPLPPQGQNTQFPNNGTAPNQNFNLGYPLFPTNVPPTNLNLHPAPPTNNLTQNAPPLLPTGTIVLPNFNLHLPPAHPHNNPIWTSNPQRGLFRTGIHHLPISHHAHYPHPIPRNPFGNPNAFNIRNRDPLFPPTIIPSRPNLRSRFLKAMTFGKSEDKVDPETAAVEFKKWEQASMVWENERCKYHIHAKGKDCRDEE